MQNVELVLVKNVINPKVHENIKPFLDSLTQCTDIEDSGMEVLGRLIEDTIKVIATSNHESCVLDDESRRLLCVHLYRLQNGIRKCSTLSV